MSLVGLLRVHFLPTVGPLPTLPGGDPIALRAIYPRKYKVPWIDTAIGLWSYRVCATPGGTHEPG